MISVRLLQVALLPEKHRQLAGISVDVADVATSSVNDMMTALVAARDPGVVTFTHTFDGEKAQGYLSECFRYSFEEINRMAPQAQCDAVVEVWRAFAAYWKCLNLRPYGLQKYRRVCAQAWGGPPIGPTDESAARTVQRDDRPYMNWEWPGQWRHDAMARYFGNRATSRLVIFGSKKDNDEVDADGQVGCSSSNTAINANCPMPGEVHRIWMQNNCFVDTTRLWSPDQVRDGGVTDSDNTDADDTDDGTGDDPSAATFWNWSAGAWEHSDPVVGQERYFVIPPLLWYWRLLCAPQPGLKVTDGGPDVSLVEWLYRLGPTEVIRTAKRDVVVKNALMLSARGRDRLSQILGDAELQEGQLHEQELADVRQIGNVMLGAAGAVLQIGGPVGLIGGAVLGIAGAVANFFPDLFAGGEQLTIDLFGRRMTVVEVYAQQDGGAALGYLESIPDPPGRVALGDPRLPPPPPAAPSSPRPGTSSIVPILPVILPGPELRDPADVTEVIQGKRTGPSVGSVALTSVAAVALGAATYAVVKRVRES